MNRTAAVAFRVFAYLGFAGTIGILSTAPTYQYADPAKAVLTLSVSHATERIAPCVMLTPQEIAELPPNMRRESTCERKRVPLVVELSIDGKTMQLEAAPSGLWSDGPASIYRQIELAPGTHRITARLRDSARPDGWDFEETAMLAADPGHYHTIKFRPETGGFRFR